MKDTTITFDRREFVLFWMASAHMTGLTGAISAAQLKLFEKGLGLDLSDVVQSIQEDEFDTTELRISDAVRNS